MVKSFYSQFRPLFLYSFLLALLIFTLKWLQWKFLIADNSLDIYMGLIALFFTGLGVWVATQLARPKVRLETVVIEKEVYLIPATQTGIDREALEQLNLSRREYEVLQLLVKGCSNADIAEQLFLSLSTVKTHVSNVFVKMEVKSRIQAIEKARQLKIIA